MRLLIPLAIVVVLVIGALVLFRMSKSKDHNAADAHRYVEAQALIDTIQDRAIEMASVGDPFAQVILDEIRTYERKTREIA